MWRKSINTCWMQWTINCLVIRFKFGHQFWQRRRRRTTKSQLRSLFTIFFAHGYQDDDDDDERSGAKSGSLFYKCICHWQSIVWITSIVHNYRMIIRSSKIMWHTINLIENLMKWSSVYTHTHTHLAQNKFISKFQNIVLINRLIIDHWLRIRNQVCPISSLLLHKLESDWLCDFCSWLKQLRLRVRRSSPPSFTIVIAKSPVRLPIRSTYLCTFSKWWPQTIWSRLYTWVHNWFNESDSIFFFFLN